MAVNPQYAATPILDKCQVTTANTAIITPTSPTLLATGTTNGKRIQRVRWMSSQLAIAAGVLRFWISLDTGSTFFLYTESLQAALTGSNTARSQSDVVPELTGVELIGAAAQLYVTTTITQTINVFCESGGL